MVKKLKSAKGCFFVLALKLLLNARSCVCMFVFLFPNYTFTWIEGISHCDFPRMKVPVSLGAFYLFGMRFAASSG